MLRDDIARYTELSGNDGLHTPIGIIGAYLDGYEKGKAETQWIPVKTRPMTEEERLDWEERVGLELEAEDAVLFDCYMPEDGQEIWVCYKNGTVLEDICEWDDFDCELEGNGDWSDIVAWMPRIKPEPYEYPPKNFMNPPEGSEE